MSECHYGPGPHADKKKAPMSQPTPGPCEMLARLARQSTSYAVNPDLRGAVDAVLGQKVYDLAPAMREALQLALHFIETPGDFQPHERIEVIDDLSAILKEIEPCPTSRS